MVREGQTLLIVPTFDHPSTGPGTSKMPVFYNPQMEFNRDFSVAILGDLLSNGDSFLDGLAATGARGIRVARESKRDIELHLNDRNPLAQSIIERKLRLNGAGDATLSQEDLRILLKNEIYDCVDIDPFGTPAPFFPMALEAVRDGGILSVTATDTGTLSGIFPGAARRRYGVAMRRTPFHHELGVRNLLGFMAREAATIDLGIQPIVAYYSDHYFRGYGRLRKGGKGVEESIANLGHCIFDEKSLEREYVSEEREGSLGPIWIGAVSDRSVLDEFRMPPHLGTAHRVAKLIELLREETNIDRPFFSIDEFSRKFKIDPPRMNDFLDSLGDRFFAVRTHFGPKSFTSDAPVDEIISAMRESTRAKPRTVDISPSQSVAG